MLLVILALSLRLWSITQTEVSARDSIGFIRQALQFQERPWREVLRENEHHPGYPLLILAVSLPVRHVLGASDSHALQLSAQLASALAGVLLVFPMFYLGRLLFDRSVGFWAAALFQCLPASARVLADGLSDGPYLLWAVLALLLGAWGLQRRSPLTFGLCGLCAGLAYLIRLEGALLVLATGLVLLGVQAVPAWRQCRRSVVACGLSLVLAALAVAGPYMVVIGGFTNKASTRIALQTAQAPRHEGSRSQKTPPMPFRYVGGPLLAIWSPDYSGDGRSRDMRWGAYALGYELLRGFNYVVCVPVLLGLWWFRKRLRQVPGTWLVLVMSLLQVLALWRLASVMGYVSERHTLIIVLIGSFWAVAAVRELPQRLSTFAAQCSGGVGFSGSSLLSDCRTWSLVLLLTLTGYGLPKTLKPLHATRAGHFAAGRWLAQHTSPDDGIVDPFCWVRFYAGRLDEEDPPLAHGGARARQYVVMDYATHHSHLPKLREAQDLAKRGRVVFHWPTQVPVDKADVLIYAVP
jgi:4-amino-4-deoxy-L-arabinose transferase-like glycosyltransferase